MVSDCRKQAIEARAIKAALNEQNNCSFMKKLNNFLTYGKWECQHDKRITSA